MSIIDDALAKYGGADEAYRQKLKKGIRDTLGYQNYMSKLGDETAKTASIGSVKGLSPAGINSRINTRFGMQDENIRTIESNAGAIDTAAGSIADKQISDAKSGAARAGTAMGFENGIAFSPKNKLEQKILAYMQNPKNPDGSVKSLQQFESELSSGRTDLGYSNIEGVGSFDENGDSISPELIKKTIEERVPKDFIGNEDKYFLMSQGYSAKQAEENAGALKRGQMGPEEQLAWDNAHPQMAKIMSASGNDPSVITDVGVMPDENGNLVPKYSFQELTAKHPGVDPTVLAGLAKPVYATAISADVFDNLPKAKAVKDLFDKGQMNPQEYAETYATFLDDEDYSNFKKTLIPLYGGMYTDKEIDQIIFDTLVNK